MIKSILKISVMSLFALLLVSFVAFRAGWFDHNNETVEDSNTNDTLVSIKTIYFDEFEIEMSSSKSEFIFEENDFILEKADSATLENGEFQTE